MSEGRRSLQDRIRARQQSGFVGRRGQVIQYQDNLTFPIDDDRRRFLFNIHGDAGVGKTFLTKQLWRMATQAGALTAYIDETAEDITSAMISLAEQLSRGGAKLGDFEKRAGEYQQRRHDLESDPHAPPGIASFLTRTAITIGLAAARDIPFAGSLVAPIDAAVAAEQANRAREYLTRKLSDHRDVRLLLAPADELTPILISGLDRGVAGRTVALFFDTYEYTGQFMDHWLRDVYAGRYGELPETLITTISGQKPLDPNLWGEYLPVIADIPLEPFTQAEARQFLASKGITHEPTIQVILTLSGRLPLWLATLADARLQGTADIGDPSGSAVHRFLKWEDDPARREIALAAALPRVLNQDVLAVLAAPDQTRELFDWLRGLPFVSRRGEAWAYHDVVRAAMLRLRRAETPAKWRSEEALLARANAEWAREAAAGIDDTWGKPEWVDYTREETYHLLCADPYGNLPRALTLAARAAARSLFRARQWATLIADAGRDTNNDRLNEWGRRLTNCVQEDDFARYLTCLINDAALDSADLAGAHSRRATIYLELRRYEQALTDYNRAMDLDPGNARAIASHAETYRLMARYDEALADFNRAIDIDPGDAWAIGSRGQTFRALKRYDAALADYNRAVDLDPDQSWIIGGRAQTYRLMDRHEEAMADYNRALDLDPDQSWIIGGRAQTYRLMDRYEEAMADFDRAVDLDPDYAWAIAGRGQTYRALNQYEEAIADYNRAVDLDPDYAWAIAGRGQTYRALNQYEEAMADYNRAVDLEPDYAWAIAGRGETDRLMGRFEEALADFNRAVDLDPRNAWTIAGRGETYRALGQYDAALADFSRAVELDPGNVRAVAGRGETYRALGQYDAALAESRRATELGPGYNDYGAERSGIRRLIGKGEDTLSDLSNLKPAAES